MSRLAGATVGIAVLAAGLFAIGLAERNLWARAPLDALDRYAPDRVLPAAMPSAPTDGELLQLCSLNWWTMPWQRRDRVAQCLDGRLPRSPDATVSELRSRWHGAVMSQIAYSRVADEVPAQRIALEVESLRASRARLWTVSGGYVLMLTDAIGETPSTPLLAAPPALASDAVAAALAGSRFVRSREYTLDRLGRTRPESGAVSTEEANWWHARNLGLLAAGLRIEHDNAREVPRPMLRPDRNSLGSRLDWARRAQSRSGEVLERTLAGWLPMLSISALMAVIVSALLAASPAITACLFIFAGVGAVHLLDIATTGPAALRHLPIRNLGDATLHAGAWQGIAVWIPGLVFVGALLTSRLAVRRLHFIVDRTVRSSWPAVGAALAAAVAVSIVAPVSAALRTELLSLIASLGCGLFMARYAPLLNGGTSGAGLAVHAMPLLGTTLATAALASYTRVDPLGTAAVLALAGLVVGLLLAHRWETRVLIVGLLALGLWTYGHYLSTGEDLTGVIDHLLPRHGRQRFLAVHDPLAFGAPDVKQVEWLCRSASGQGLIEAGWGFGSVPWSGLPGVSDARPLPIPAVSDLAWVMLCAVGGNGYALAVVAFLIGTLLALVRRGLLTALGSHATVTQRLLGATAGIGLLIATVRAIVNLAGNWQVLPLAGVPVVFIAHAPAAAAFALAYAGLALGASVTYPTASEARQQ